MKIETEIIVETTEKGNFIKLVAGDMVYTSPNMDIVQCSRVLTKLLEST